MSSHNSQGVWMDQAGGDQILRGVQTVPAGREPASGSPCLGSSHTDVFVHAAPLSATPDESSPNKGDSAYPFVASILFCPVQCHQGSPVEGSQDESNSTFLPVSHSPHVRTEPSTFQSSTAMSVHMAETPGARPPDAPHVGPSPLACKPALSHLRCSVSSTTKTHQKAARPVGLCAQFRHEGKQIFSRRAFCFDLNGRDWRQVFGASRFTCLDPFFVFLIRLALWIPMVGVAGWDLACSFPFVYFTTWTNFFAATHACVALGSSVATLVSLSRDHDEALSCQKGDSPEKESCGRSSADACVVPVGAAKPTGLQSVRPLSESRKGVRHWPSKFFRLRSWIREAYRRLLSDPSLCRDGIIFVPGFLAPSPYRCAELGSPPGNQLVHPSKTNGVDTSSRDASKSDVEPLGEASCSTGDLGVYTADAGVGALGRYNGFPLIQEKDMTRAHLKDVPAPAREGKGAMVKSTAWERLCTLTVFATSMIGLTSSLITVVLFWCVLVPTGTFFRKPIHVLCHSVCLLSSFILAFTGRVPFLLYHCWLLLCVGLAYTIMNVVTYAVPLRVGDQVGYIYSIFNFPARPLQAWFSFVFVGTVGLCLVALIPWLCLWKSNTLFDPPHPPRASPCRD